MAAARAVVHARERVLPLPAPLRLGPMRIAQRHYTVVEIDGDDGARGVAFAQTRGAPVAEIVERLLAPVLASADAADIDARFEDMFRATIAVGRVGLVMRAISLVDLALWDLRGRRAQAPVHRLLGAQRERVPVTYVAGYPQGHDEVEAVVDAAVAASTRGHATIKVARAPDPAVTRALLARLDSELPATARVIVDANWGWRTVAEALAELDGWPAPRLAWVEDPFAPEEALMLAELRRRAPIAVGAGDDLTDRVHVRRLLEHEAVDVLRLDVAAAGGITGVWALAGEAQVAGVPVSFHISAEASIHLAAAHPACRDIETFDRSGNRFDPSHELVVGGPSFDGGTAGLPAGPGLGFEVADEGPLRAGRHPSGAWSPPARP